jgi:hypothetical protein
MRVALLASTFALLAGSPAFAQCVYVGCSGQAPAYQQPVYQTPSAPPSTAPGYEEGYAAGLAARPLTRERVVTRYVTRHTTTPRARQSTPAHATGARRHVASTAPRIRHVVASPVRRHVVKTASAPRRNVAQVIRRSPVRVVTTQTITHSTGAYRDPIKDRAATYRPPVYGQATSMASLMSRSTSYSASSSSSSVTWTGPASVVNQGGQVCGWGARIVTNAHGYAQRQAVWVCQCPQGWRPPGY